MAIEENELQAEQIAESWNNITGNTDLNVHEKNNKKLTNELGSMTVQ